MELWRLIKAHPEVTHGQELVKLLMPGLLGMVCSFVAGYLALKLLSRLLEAGPWKYFGYYCLVASAVVFGLAHAEKSASASTVNYGVPAQEAPIPASDTNAAPFLPATTNVFTSGTNSTTGTLMTNMPQAPTAPATNAPGH
jgi:hypothetical protein